MQFTVKPLGGGVGSEHMNSFKKEKNKDQFWEYKYILNTEINNIFHTEDYGGIDQSSHIFKRRFLLSPPL